MAKRLRGCPAMTRTAREAPTAMRMGRELRRPRRMPKRTEKKAAMSDAAAVTGLAACSSDLHRAFWLLVHHPKRFEAACDVDYADSHVGQAQHIDLQVRISLQGFKELVESGDELSWRGIAAES